MAVRRSQGDDDGKTWDRVWIGAHVATMTLGGEPYGSQRDTAVAVKGERIAWVGPASAAAERAAAEHIPVHDVTGRWLTPGLIDCHTHLIYGGNRVAEYEQRLGGATYEDIARSGGGIQATVRATRAATADGLRASAMARARRLMGEGVTTLEIKSGYGLDLPTERRLLEVARTLGRELPLSVRTTFLGCTRCPRNSAVIGVRTSMPSAAHGSRRSRRRGSRMPSTGSANRSPSTSPKPRSSCGQRVAWGYPRTYTPGN